MCFVCVRVFFCSAFSRIFPSKAAAIASALESDEDTDQEENTDELDFFRGDAVWSVQDDRLDGRFLNLRSTVLGDFRHVRVRLESTSTAAAFTTPALGRLGDVLGWNIGGGAGSRLGFLAVRTRPSKSQRS
eukprot:TRINITY_DN5073_c0_g2_i1.p1 TRINITY_DN5073_c0_g2~~TRINITY_DN5073_c0_g2_i1.p1  ORF type:complete len:131 (+),score=19.55 TRINITY_DN5073_c0_g2_i1:39-431(+)